MEFGPSLSGEADIVISSTAQPHLTVTLTWDHSGNQTEATGRQQVAGGVRAPDRTAPTAPGRRPYDGLRITAQQGNCWVPPSRSRNKQP